MTVYPLLFGRVDWPEDPPPRRRPRLAVGDCRPTTERLAVEVPSALKRSVEQSAALAGLSADVWIASALARSVDPRLGTS